MSDVHELPVQKVYRGIELYGLQSEARIERARGEIDAVIVVGGSWGTLSELALAKRRGGVPVISLGGWQLLDKDGVPIEGVQHVSTAEEAVERVMASKHSAGQ